MTQPPQPPQQQPPPAYGYSAPMPDHPQATLVLVLGILGLVVCQLIGPFAWVMGNRVVAEIDASGGQVGGRSAANAGRICGIVATILIGVALLVTVAALVIVLVAAASAGG